MAHIRDLHINILQRVLAYFYGGFNGIDTIHEFKQLLPPAAVCHIWREHMLQYVYRTAFLEYRIKEADDYSEAAQTEYEWKSNIDLIVSQRFNSTIRRLIIESLEYPPNFTDMIHALDVFGFSSSHWRAVNLLYINMDRGVVVHESVPSSSGDEALATQLTEYFGGHLPNIGNLLIHIRPESNVSRLLSNKLSNLYINQLHALDCFLAPITFSCHSFSSRLRHLSVYIASGVSNRLPQLLASPLEILELFNIPHNFAWWTFIGKTPGHIEFTNLRILWLRFGPPSDNAEKSNNSSKQVATSTVSLNIGCRKLFFPKLRKLHIIDSPYNDGALYSMFAHSPLQTVKIYSSFKAVQHMDPRILSNAADVHFTIHSVSPEDYNDYAEFYRKLLGTYSNAKTALLGVYNNSVPLLIPNTIEWINVEDLTLSANIDLGSVIQVITQLPKLHKLFIENVVDEINEAGANLQVILRGRLAHTPSISTSVKSLSICSNSRPLVFSLDVMRYLAVLVHSLDEVAVPDMYISDIKEFASHHANAFPHLRIVKVRGAF